MESPYNKAKFKDNRKQLRNNGTSAEAVLWLSLKNKQLGGRKFRRQCSIDRLIVDFYCPEERIVIELDGAHHFTPDGSAMDYERDMFLKSIDIAILRFENRLVFENLQGVLEEIQRNFKE